MSSITARLVETAQQEYIVVEHEGKTYTINPDEIDSPLNYFKVCGIDEPKSYNAQILGQSLSIDW